MKWEPKARIAAAIAAAAGEKGAVPILAGLAQEVHNINRQTAQIMADSAEFRAEMAALGPIEIDLDCVESCEFAPRIRAIRLEFEEENSVELCHWCGHETPCRRCDADEERGEMEAKDEYEEAA